MDLGKLRETATSFQHCRLIPDAPVLVGVSGGPDSLCLLDALARLGFPVVAAHFDHRLRPGSDKDVDVVHAAAEKWGLSCLSGSADVAGYALAERVSIEDAARTLRYRFLFAQARQISAQAVAVGHTADDQVETVLMHLLRGTGLSGLKGMIYRVVLPDWDSAIPLVRPLLPFWREETLAYCQEYELTPVFDPSNQENDFFRNRLRHELIPFLETLNHQARQNIWRTTQALAGDEAVVQSVVQAEWEACLAEQGSGYVALRLGVVRAQPPGVQRGIFRLASAAAQGAAYPRDMDFAALERAERFLQSPGGQIDLVNGLRLWVEGDRLMVAGPGAMLPEKGWPQLAALELPLSVPGDIHLAPGWRLTIAWASPGEVPDFSAARPSPWEAWLDADALSGKLTARRARPGERFQPLGMDGRSMKLSDLWINQKLPRRARASWPVIASGDVIAWIPGFRQAQPFAIRAQTRRALHLRLVQHEK